MKSHNLRCDFISFFQEHAEACHDIKEKKVIQLQQAGACPLLLSKPYSSCCPAGYLAKTHN
jgi:hypothetical protein